MPLVVRTASLSVFALSALVGLVAVVEPRLAIVGALAIVFGVLMLTDVRIGIVLFALVSTLLEGVAAGSISADKVVGFTLILSWLASLVVRPSLRDEIASHTPVFLGLIVVLGAWYTLSVSWALDPGEAQYQLVRLFPNLLIIPVVVSAINDARTLRWVIGAFLIGVLISALYGLLVGGVGDAANEGRLAGSDLDSNSLAVWLVMAASLSVGVLGARIEPSVRLLAAVGMGLAGLAVLATGSRTGLIAAASVLVLAPVLLGRGRRLAAVAALALAVLAGSVYITAFADPVVRDRITSGDTDGGSGRTSLWTLGARMVEANPVGGVGGGNFRNASVRYLLEPGQVRDTRYIIDRPEGAHNTYLQVAAETGLVGGLLFVAIFVTALLYAVRAARHFGRTGQRDLGVLAAAIALAFIGVGVGSSLVAFDSAKPLWLLIALGPAVLKLARVNGLRT